MESLLKQALTQTLDMELLQTSSDLEKVLDRQESMVPADVQPVSPDVLAEGYEDLYIHSAVVHQISEPAPFTDLDLEQLFPTLGCVLDDSIGGGDLAAALGELQEPLGTTDLSSLDTDDSVFDVDKLLGLDNDTMADERDCYAGKLQSSSPCVTPTSPEGPSSLESSPSSSFGSEPGSPAQADVEVAHSIVISHSDPSQVANYMELKAEPQPQLSTVCLAGLGLGTTPVGDTTPQPSVSAIRQVRFEPYARQKPRGKGNGQRSEGRKERKRLQNQQAATRYRQKKRKESDLLQDEARLLRDENTELEDKVSSLQKEIEYMKGLLVEVLKAKGLLENFPATRA